MTFISYAQTYEDVMLARAFAGITDGFYIDVGAQDPRFDSVTKAFYDLGWHGINLEPVESWHRKLVEARPRDVNLCLAAGDHEGTIEFHETDETGLSTASAEFAARHRAQGHALRTRQVRVSTLDAICRAHDVHEVHFLKVDVEGAEAEVLRGLDLRRLRPWIILVEATEPNSRVSTHESWEHLVTGHGYRMVYQDGINRFYLAREHEALAPAFDAPPNILDDFVRREQVDLGAMLQARIDELERQHGAVDRLAALRAERIDELEAAQRGLAERLDEEHALSLRRLAESEERAATIARLGREQEALQHALSAARADLEQARDETARAREETARAREETALARGEIGALQAALAELQDQAEALAQRAAQSEQAVVRLSRELADARAELHATFDAYTRELGSHAGTLAELARAQAHFAEVVNSRSWRITAPLRRAMTAIGSLRARLLRLARRLAATPVGRQLARGARRLAPALVGRLRDEVGDPNAVVVDGELVAPAPGEPEPLPLGRDALAILQRFPVGAPARGEPR